MDLGVELQEIVASGAVTDLLTECREGVLEGWTDGSLEDWMVFLSPMQQRAVDRAANGPCRITGGPGTGKTVVGLHRAKALTAELERNERVLMTSFVNTVTRTLGGLFGQIAPHRTGRAEFRTVHELALGQLSGSLSARVDGDAARSRFGRVLVADKSRHRTLLFDCGYTEEYLWEEVTRVIIGRGVASQSDYRQLKRTGRRQRMSSSARDLLWDVYEEYRDACHRGEAVVDWDSVLRLARDHARANGPRRRYAAIVIDEAQDITQVGIEFLLEMLKDGPRGQLMLIGDGGQRLYPAGSACPTWTSSLPAEASSSICRIGPPMRSWPRSAPWANRFRRMSWERTVRAASPSPAHAQGQGPSSTASLPRKRRPTGSFRSWNATMRAWT